MQSKLEDDNDENDNEDNIKQHPPNGGALVAQTGSPDGQECLEIQNEPQMNWKQKEQPEMQDDAVVEEKEQSNPSPGAGSPDQPGSSREDARSELAYVAQGARPKIFPIQRHRPGRNGLEMAPLLQMKVDSGDSRAQTVDDLAVDGSGGGRGNIRTGRGIIRHMSTQADDYGDAAMHVHRAQASKMSQSAQTATISPLKDSDPAPIVLSQGQMIPLPVSFPDTSFPHPLQTHNTDANHPERMTQQGVAYEPRSFISPPRSTNNNPTSMLNEDIQANQPVSMGAACSMAPVEMSLAPDVLAAQTWDRNQPLALCQGTVAGCSSKYNIFNDGLLRINQANGQRKASLAKPPSPVPQQPPPSYSECMQQQALTEMSGETMQGIVMKQLGTSRRQASGEHGDGYAQPPAYRASVNRDFRCPEYPTEGFTSFISFPSGATGAKVPQQTYSPIDVSCRRRSEPFPPAPDHQFIAFLSCLVCWPVGLVAIYYSNLAHINRAEGRWAQASAYSKMALIVSLVALSAGAVTYASMYVYRKSTAPV